MVASRNACLFLLALLILSTSVEARGQTKAESLVTGLNVPLGIAVERESGTVIVSESGAGRVVRIEKGKPESVVAGFPLAAYGPAGSFQAGPAALAMIDKQTIAVVDAGAPEGLDAVRVFKLPEPGKPASNYPDALAKFGPLAPRGTQQSAGVLAGIAWHSSVLVYGSYSDEPQAWLARVIRTGEKWSDAKRFVATRDAVGMGGPSALTTSIRGEVVVGQAGTLDKPGDSLLCFYNVNTGKLLLNQLTGLHDVVALEYSPKSGQLYALDLAWNQPADAGLYQLVAAFKDGRPALTSKKILALERPTAMAFQANGQLLLTVLGPAASDASKSGQVLSVAAGL